MSTLLQELEARIAGPAAALTRQSVGVVREVGDGVARVEGLRDVMLNEMLDLGNGVTGIALSLEENDVGVIVLGDDTRLQEGGEVRGTGKLLQVPVGKGLLGRVVNTLGEPLDGKGPIASDSVYPVEAMAPGIMKRRPVSQPVQTGIMAIDAMIPIGRGQRELIIGDRATGKTTICIDTIINQARLNSEADARGDAEYRRLYCIYVAIGQKQSTIAQLISVLEAAEAMPYTIVVAAPAADSATSRSTRALACCSRVFACGPRVTRSPWRATATTSAGRSDWPSSMTGKGLSIKPMRRVGTAVVELGRLFWP